MGSTLKVRKGYYKGSIRLSYFMGWVLSLRNENMGVVIFDQDVKGIVHRHFLSFLYVYAPCMKLGIFRFVWKTRAQRRRRENCLLSWKKELKTGGKFQLTNLLYVLENTIYSSICCLFSSSDALFYVKIVFILSKLILHAFTIFSRNWPSFLKNTLYR